MAQPTERQQLVNVIRTRIWEILAEAPVPDESDAIVRDHNRDGWTIEIRFIGRDYAGPRDYTRVESVRLSDEELAQAIAWAEERMRSTALGE